MFEGAPIIVLGYPGIVGNEYLVRAVSRGGIVAWTRPETPFDSKFLVDANIYPGNSGSPVIAIPTTFVIPQGLRVATGGRLLGLVSGGPVQNLAVTAGGQPVIFNNPSLPQPVQMETRIKGVGSFGVIEPASKIVKLLQSFRPASAK